MVFTPLTATSAADLPGLGIDLQLVSEQAQGLRTQAKSIEAGTDAVVIGWTPLSASYESTGAESIYAAMTPVGAAGTAIAECLRGAAKAFDDYVSAAGRILADVQDLAGDIAEFQGTLGGYPMTVPLHSRAAQNGGVQVFSSWKDNPGAVEQNEALSMRARRLEGQLLIAQEECASAIRKAAGVAPKGVSAVRSLAKALSTEDAHWNAISAVNENKEGCAGGAWRVFDHLGNGLIDGAEGIPAFVGWDVKNGQWSPDVADAAVNRLSDTADGGITLLASTITSGLVWVVTDTFPAKDYAQQQATDPSRSAAERAQTRRQVGDFEALESQITGIAQPQRWWDPNAWKGFDPWPNYEQDLPGTVGDDLSGVAALAIGEGGGSVLKAGLAARGVEAAGKTTTLDDLAADGRISRLQGLDADSLNKVLPGIEGDQAGSLSKVLAGPQLDRDGIAQLHLGNLHVDLNHLPDQPEAHDPQHSVTMHGDVNSSISSSTSGGGTSPLPTASWPRSTDIPFDMEPYQESAKATLVHGEWNPESDMRTPTNSAVFWSGRTGDTGGEALANGFAQGHGASTLEGVLSARRVPIPEWSPATVSEWQQASRLLAEEASGVVHVVLGADVNPRGVWTQFEYPALRENVAVTEIIAVDPLTGAQTVLFTR